jgi:N-acetylglucosamine-6-phosphate deacetylase
MSNSEVPGFVDLQVNGFRGVDFSSPDLSEEGFERVCRDLPARGTALFLPTLITAPTEVYERNLPLMAKLMKRPEIVRHVPGFHLEGPFISPEEGARGMHRSEWIRLPDVPLLDRLQDLAGGGIRMITVAAELPGVDELVKHASEQGIVVSLGHQLADEEAVDRLSHAGARALTHLGNGVPEQLHRHRNPVWAGLAVESLSAMFVADGHHLPDSLLKIFLRTKGVSKCIAVSDASPLSGLSPGSYQWGGVSVVLEEDGRLHQAHGPYLAGSSATLLICMNHLASLGVLAPDELRRLGYDNPLDLIGCEPPPAIGGVSVRFDRKTGQWVL